MAGLGFVGSGFLAITSIGLIIAFGFGSNFTVSVRSSFEFSNVFAVFVEGLDQYDQQEQVVDNEVYTTYVVFEDNGQQIVLLQQSDMDFTEEGNYILVIEHDDTTDSGFKMTLERTVTEQS